MVKEVKSRFRGGGSSEEEVCRELDQQMSPKVRYQSAYVPDAGLFLLPVVGEAEFAT